MEEIKVTNHAYTRMKERTGYSPSDAQKVAEKAYYCGKDIKDFKNDASIKNNKPFLNVLSLVNKEYIADSKW